MWCGMSTAHAYCTYFDSGYLSRGIALIESLRSHGDNSPIWIMTLDQAAHDYLSHAALEGVHLITVAALEAEIPELLPLKSERSRMEYYFTCTPLLIRYVMDRTPGDRAVAYLDADLYFFEDPATVFEAMGDGSVGIIEHRYPARLARRLAKYGRFNVGWVGFRNDAAGRACLEWWGASTLEWCSDTPEGGKYADQGYLDRFPEFDGVTILPSPGMNLAPWNTASSRIALNAGRIAVDRDPLVFFHVHGLKLTGRWYVTAQLVYGAPTGHVLREGVYRPYVEHIERIGHEIAASALVPPTTVAARGRGIRGLLFRAQRAAIKAVSIARRSAIAVPAREPR